MTTLKLDDFLFDGRMNFSKNHGAFMKPKREVRKVEE